MNSDATVYEFNYIQSRLKPKIELVNPPWEMQARIVRTKCPQVDKDLLRGYSDLINVRFGPLCGLKSDISRGPRSAKLGLMHRSKQRRTGGAAARRIGG